MSITMTGMMILVMIILGFSFIYTWNLARQQKTAGGKLDSPIPKPVQKHAYVRNPIFLSYIIFFALLLSIVLFIALSVNQ